MTQIDISLPTRPTSGSGDVTEIGDYLAQLESKRRRQLDKLPNDRIDPVAMAHRAAVEQIVEEVSTARQRLDSGLYGICVGCAEAIDPARLEFRPWAIRCTGCSKRSA